MRWRLPAAAVALALVLGVALSLLLNLVVPAATFEDGMPGGPYRYEGMFDPPYDSYGYFDPEMAPTGESYRWTTAHAFTTFPYAANAGREATISMRLGAFQASAQNPISLEVRLNGKPYSHIMVAGAFQVYTMTLDTRQTPNPFLDPAHIQVDLLSETRSTAQDPRQLGVAVDWIAVRPVRGWDEIALEAAAWALFLAVVMAVGSARLGLRWGALFAAGALLSFTLLHLTYVPRSVTVAVEVALAGVAWLIAALLAPRRLPIVGLALAACLLWVVVAGRILGEWQMDDAFISYRYAWNLVHGNGLVYNPGEAVEGYTNFLWTDMSAGALLLGWDPASVAQAANMLVSMLLIGLAYLASSLLVGIRGRGQVDELQITDYEPRTPLHVAGRELPIGESSQAHRPGTGRRPLTTITQQPPSGADAPDPRALTPSPWPLLVAGLLAVDVSLVFYGAKGSGMEAASFALMLLLAIVLLWGWAEARRRVETMLRVGGGLALALASLLRPEGLFVAVLLLAVRVWQDRREKLPVLPRLGAAALPFLVIIVPYQVWRISFYGYLFPNTFYAKTGLSLALLERGIVYVGGFALPHWLVALAAFSGCAAWLAAWLRSARKRDNGAKQRLVIHGMLPALFLLTAVYTLYTVEVGGDHFPAARFFVPLLAPLVLLAQEAFRGGLRLLDARRGARLVAIAALSVAVLVYAGTSLWLQTEAGPLGQRGNRETTAWERWGSAGLWLRENTPQDTVLAAFAAGAMSYFSDRYTVDMLGLSDVHIAHINVADIGSGVAGHEKRDPVYVLSRRPDYILATWEDYFSSIAGEIKAAYAYRTVDSPTGTPVKWLRRNDAKGP